MRIQKLAATVVFLSLALTLLPGVATAQSPPEIQPSLVRQLAALEQLKSGRSPEQKKIQSRLLLAVLAQRGDPLLRELPDLRVVAPDADGRILVDVDLLSPEGVEPVLQRLEETGGEIRSVSPRYAAIRARVPLDQVEAVAALAEVRKVGLARQAFTNAQTRSEGDITHRAAEARELFGGTCGITGGKICVLSDGVDSLAAFQASGDLPAVDVLPGQAGSGDEGLAMLKVVHDLNPGAAPGFATATTDLTTFAQNILDLRASGCDVLVDDISYPVESPFQDSLVADAVNQVTAGGALYFSAAGNGGNLDAFTTGTWEGDFNPNGSLAGFVGTAHNFGDGGQSNLVIGDSALVTLHWSDPFGTAANNYDLYIADGGLTTIFDASIDDQDGVGGDDDPVEITGGAFFFERIVVTRVAGAGRMIHVDNVRGQVLSQTSGCIRGHNSAADAFAVAAVNVATALPGPFTGGAANPNEFFNCDGPRRIFFDADGNLLPGAPPGDFSATGGVVRNHPDLAAADGVSTFAGFDPFIGTSAAAAHAAAIAGLVKARFPAMTPAAIRTALQGSALDNDAPGFDRNSGAGIVMAFEALQSLGAAPQAFLHVGGATPGEVSGDGDAFIETNEDWSLGVQLTNVGGATATVAGATLSSATPGVEIIVGSSATPLSIAPGGTAAISGFQFTPTAAVPCGATIHLTLTVNYSGGACPQTLDVALKVGQPGTPVTFSYTGPSVPIPDAPLFGTTPGDPADAILPVAGFTGNVFDLDLRIDGAECSADIGSTTVGLDHTFINDLRLRLIAPDSTLAVVVDRTDGGGNNLCQTVLDDGATTSIQSVTSAMEPFTGTFTPNNTLSIFEAESPNGPWRFQAQDYNAFDTGTIHAW